MLLSPLLSLSLPPISSHHFSSFHRSRQHQRQRYHATTTAITTTASTTTSSILSRVFSFTTRTHASRSSTTITSYVPPIPPLPSPSLPRPCVLVLLSFLRFRPVSLTRWGFLALQMAWGVGPVCFEQRTSVFRPITCCIPSPGCSWSKATILPFLPLVTRIPLRESLSCFSSPP